MKNLSIIILFLAFSLNAMSQKKKNASSKPNKTSNVLAKMDNITLEINKNNLNLYILNGKIKDSINIKNTSVVPTDVNLKSFSTKGNKFYLLSYTEKSSVQNANKTEDILSNNVEIFDLVTKTKIYSNVQKTTKITEKVFLDRLKNASETQEKIRNEGYSLSLLPDGDIMLTSKTKSKKMTFDSATRQFVDSNKKK